MSKLDETVALYQSEFRSKLNMSVDKNLLEKVAKGLGPVIYNPDASRVSGSDPKELQTVKTNFLIKKLGLKDSPALDTAISEVMEQMGISNRNKYRAMVYYLLTKKFNKEHVYN